MTDYSSVKNTAKNGKLIRAEIREYILAMALVFGFNQDKVWSEKLYPDNPYRQQQCTLLHIPKLIDGMEPEASLFHLHLLVTFESYFKRYATYSDPRYVLFYDTKKFRIYYDRLRYGLNHKVNLHRTMQYMWTPVLLTMLYIYGYDKEKQAIDLNKFWFFKNSWNTEHTISQLENWLLEVLYNKIGNLGAFKVIDDHYLWLEKPHYWEDTAYDNIYFITQKLRAGKYIYH